MKLRQVLMKLAGAIAEEAERNPSFHENLVATLHSLSNRPKGQASKAYQDIGVEGLSKNATALPAIGDAVKRPANRRAPAVLDPVQLAREDESQLRTALSPLGLDQLRDIVAEYGMDHGGLAMKWKNPERVIERIVEVAVQRARKGDAFRDQGEAVNTNSN